MTSCQGYDWYMSLHVHVLDCWILLPYLPGKQLLRLQLHSLFISSLCLIWLFQFTGCQANEHPCIVIVLFYLQNSLKSQIEESSYERLGVFMVSFGVQTNPLSSRYCSWIQILHLAVFQSLFKLLVLNGLSGTLQCCFHFLTWHHAFIYENKVQRREINTQTLI